MNFPTYYTVPLPNTEELTNVTDFLRDDKDLLGASATAMETQGVRGDGHSFAGRCVPAATGPVLTLCSGRATGSPAHAWALISAKYSLTVDI